MLRQARELPRPGGPETREGEPVEELLHHPLREARGLHLQQARGDDHRAVDGDPAGVVAHEHRAASRGDVADAEGVDAEVVAVHRRERREGAAQVLARDAVGVQAERVEGQLEPIDAVTDVLVEAEAQALARVN